METKTADYRRHIELWTNSGKSKINYCREHNLSYQTFFYHLKWSKKETKPKKFVQVQIKEKEKDTPAGNIELHLVNGSRLVFLKGSSALFIRQVVFGC